MTSDPDCVFCRIMAGRASASFVARTATAAAFMDLNPVTPGHLLVVANDHFVGLTDTPPTVLADMTELGRRCASALRASSFRSEGINLFLADGAAAFQEVFHVHLHVLPRYNSDSFRIHTGRELGARRHQLDTAAAELSGLLPEAAGSG